MTSVVTGVQPRKNSGLHIKFTSPEDTSETQAATASAALPGAVSGEAKSQVRPTVEAAEALPGAVSGEAKPQVGPTVEAAEALSAKDKDSIAQSKGYNNVYEYLNDVLGNNDETNDSDKDFLKKLKEGVQFLANLLNPQQQANSENTSGCEKSGGCPGGGGKSGENAVNRDQMSLPELRQLLNKDNAEKQNAIQKAADATQKLNEANKALEAATSTLEQVKQALNQAKSASGKEEGKDNSAQVSKLENQVQEAEEKKKEAEKKVEEAKKAHETSKEEQKTTEGEVAKDEEAISKKQNNPSSTPAAEDNKFLTVVR